MGSVGTSIFEKASTSIRSPPRRPAAPGCFYTLKCEEPLIEPGIEGWGPTACWAFVLPGVLLVGLLRDHCFDAPGAELAADDAVGVGLIGNHRIRADPQPPGTQAGDVDVVDDLGEHSPVVALPAGEHDRQRHPVGIHSSMQLR